MGKSLKDLFEISEVLDIRQEMIAKILMHTSDEDNNPADEPFTELARKLEEREISVKEAQDALDAMTKDTMEEDIETIITPKSSQDKAELKKKVKKDPSKSSIEKIAISNAIDDAKPGEEIIAEELDDEGRMAKSDLLKLTQYSAKLYKALGDSDQLPAWIQAKITLAADYIGTVKHYLEGEQVMGGEEAPSGQLEEAKGDVEYYNWEDLHLAIFISKPVEEISDRVMLPLGIDGKLQLNLGNYKRMLALPDDYKSKFGTKEELVKRELGYLERDFYNWKDKFNLEGDEEVVVTCPDEFTCVVKADAITKISDKYAAGKAKGDTSDVYESSIVKILSK